MLERVDKHYWAVFLNVFVNAILYLIIGGIQILNSIGNINSMFLGNNPLEGFILLLMALVFLYGTRCFLRGQEVDGYAFAVAGALLMYILFMLQAIVLSTHALGCALNLEDWAQWQITDDVTPSLWMFPLALPIIRFYRMQRPRNN